MIRMVTSSFHNTLINKEEAIPMSTMLEIDRIRNNKILFTITTNRLLKEILYYNNDFPFIDYIISLNGSYIYDLNKNKCIYKNKLDIETIKEIEKYFNKIIYYTEENYYNNRDNINDILKIEIPINKKDINKINILNNLNISKSIFNYNKKYYIEITSKKDNIYEGIKKILELEKINNNEIISIIGNLSDKEIINNIENTYIVSNSNKGVENILKKI